MRTFFGVMFLFCALVNSVMATDSPEDLAAWKDWVLQDHKDIDCPAMPTTFSQRRCVWPSRLQLTVSENTARFTQRWVVYSKSWVKLPGNQKQWPVDVTVNGKAHPIAVYKGAPAALLEAGEYAIEGQIQWDSAPQFIAIPADTGLVSLTLEGRDIEQPNVEAGRLWLSRQAAKKIEGQQDTLSVTVFRRFTDTIPFVVTTQMQLKVSGKAREVILGRMLMPGMTARLLSSPLPARLEADGRIRLQVRPGDWRINLQSHAVTPPHSIEMKALDDSWPKQEIWSFEAQRQLRGVEWRGGRLGDPAQLNVPRAWAQLPAYVINEQDQVTFEERYRGDANPAPNQLSLRRDIWLDFSGAGFTVKDVIEGEVHRADRFTMSDGYQLGRATLNGQPQLITTMNEASAGVEVPAGFLNLEAVSRFPLQGRTMSASGWHQDMGSVAGVLNLPPGWKLLHGTGVDRVSGSWLTRWSLWDLFLCLVIAGAAARVLGLPWGVLAGLTLALTYQETQAPVLLWMNALLVLALIKVIPQGSFSKLLRYYQMLSVLALVVAVLGFSVDQIRKGIYPQLEYNTAIANAYSGAEVEYDQVHEREAQEQLQMAKREAKSQRLSMSESMAPMAQRPVMQDEGYKTKRPKYDANARVQTGPGLPQWQWNRVHLNWSGPVLERQSATFYLLPPGLSRLWRLLSVILVAVWLLGVIRQSVSSAWLQTAKLNGNVAALILAPWLLITTPDSQADYPSAHLLEQLQQRLVAAPDCMPQCASVGRVAIDAGDDRLSVNLAVDALAGIQMPLPSGDWRQTAVLLNGEAAMALSRNTKGQLSIALQPGQHRVTLIGRIHGDSAAIVFPVKPHNVTLRAESWEVAGLINGAVPSGTIQMDREKKETTSTVRETTLLPNAIAPFVLVRRQLNLGAEWEVITTVTRVAPTRGAINLSVPLLAGESVLSNSVQVIQDHAQVTLPATQKAVRWTSRLEEVDSLRLKAPEGVAWSEQWQVVHSPRWNVRAQGINPVKAAAASAPVWQPWPGEELTVQVQKPLPTKGPSQTVEQLALSYKPGNTSSETELKLQVRASLGGYYPLLLPEGADVQSVEIDGQAQAIQLEGHRLQLPIHPGTVDAVVRWRVPHDGSTVLSTPALRLPSVASNVRLTLQLPRDRWPLFLAGPDIGPAMLFWGVLIVILIVSGVLGWGVKRFDLDIPVRTYQWFLLGLGVSTVSVVGGVLIVLWFAAMAARKNLSQSVKYWQFNLVQIGLLLLTIAAVGSLVATVPSSLLSTPDMQVVGNQSSNFNYIWYQDHSSDNLPQGWVFSLPIGVYRAVMLVWSLWLMIALLDWVRWGWNCFSRNGLFLRKTEPAASSDA